MEEYRTSWTYKANMWLSVLRIRDVYPGSRIRLFSSRIPDPNCLHPGSWIRTKEFKYFNPEKTKKMVSKLWIKWSGLFIPDPGSGCWLSTHPGFRIPDPGVKKAPDLGSRILIRNTGGYLQGIGWTRSRRASVRWRSGWRGAPGGRRSIRCHHPHRLSPQEGFHNNVNPGK